VSEDSFNSLSILLFFALFILTSFSLSLILFRLSFLFSILVLLGIVLNIGVIIGVYYHLKASKTLKEKRRVVLRFFILFGVVWILFQFIIIGGLQYEYLKIKDEYSIYYADYQNKNPNESLNASWELTQKYYNTFLGTYAVQGAFLPNRGLVQQYIPFVNPILDYYFSNMNGLKKMIIIQNKGNCGEFSQSIAFLLNETSQNPTRLVSFEGIDHMMPEISINNQWWVFDRVYLTPSKPINYQQFFSYIPSEVRNNIANMYFQRDTPSLLKEHGFNETRYTITAISDLTSSGSDNIPMKDVNVEFYALNNSYDPVVAKGITDENGKFSATLNPDKEYWVVAKYEPLPILPVQKLVGVEYISRTTQTNLSIPLYLHKYD